VQQILGSITPPDVSSTQLFFERVAVDDFPAGFLFGGRFAAAAFSSFPPLSFSSFLLTVCFASLSPPFSSPLFLLHFLLLLTLLFLHESTLVSSLAQGRVFFGADGVAVGSTRYLYISDSLLLCFLLSPVEIEAPDPGDTFADPEGVEVTIVATFLSALPLVPSLTALPLEIALVAGPLISKILNLLLEYRHYKLE